MLVGRIRSKKSTWFDCLILLCLNFIGDVWALLSRITQNDHVSYKQFLQNDFSVYSDLILAVIGFFIFFIAIVFLICSELSMLLISAIIIVSLLDAFYIICSIVQITSDDDTKKKYMNMKHAIERKLSDERDALESYYSFMTLMFILLLICLAFKLYTASLFYSYKFELMKRNNVHDTSNRQNGGSTGNTLNAAPPSHTPPSHHLNQRLCIPSNLPQNPPSLSPPMPCDSRIIPLKSPSKASQCVDQNPDIPPSPPQRFPSQHPQSSTQPTQPSKFPHNPCSIPLSQSPTQPPRCLNQRLEVSSSPSQLPHNSCSIPLSESPTQPPKYLNQGLNVPSSLSQKSPSVLLKFPYNSSSVPLTFSNRCPSQHLEFPYQSPNIPFTSSSQSASKSLRFPYNSSNIPLTLSNRSPSKSPQFPYQAPNIPFSSPSQSTSKTVRFPYNSPNIPLSFT